MDEDHDWSKDKGIADESHFNEFVPLARGELVSPLIRKQGVKNADYLFRSDRIVAEHKILETDFAQTPEVIAKVDTAFAKYPNDKFDAPTHPLYRELFGILRIPIKRIVEKANKQIRETKLELNLLDHRGLIFLVNDNFRTAPPGLVRDIIRNIVGEKERYRSVDCVIYMTNHYVELSEVPFATLLWAPIYKGNPSKHLHEFVDWLGAEWSAYMERKIGPFDGSAQMNNLDWNRAYVVSGPSRFERYEGDDV